MALSTRQLEALLEIYRRNPEAYFKQVLKQNIWSKQKAFMMAMKNHSRVMMKASHGVGKTHVMAGGVNWFYDCFDGKLISTAPSAAQVEDVLWTEVRSQRGDRGGHNHMPPKAPRIQDPSNPAHFAVGMTAANTEGFHGRHTQYMWILFDEAVGIKPDFFTAAEGMMVGPDRHWGMSMNPTNTDCQAYLEFLSGSWNVITVSGLDHPNILAALRGQEPPYPNAVQIGFVDNAFRKWAIRVDPRDRRAGDIWWCLPDKNGVRDFNNPKLYRPNQMMEGKVLGRWPKNSGSAVWSDAIWMQAAREEGCGLKPIPDSEIYSNPAYIGCDCAWSGSDFTSIIGQRGGAALTYDTGNGWRIPEITMRIKDAALELANARNARRRNLPGYVGETIEDVTVQLDHDAVGFNVIGALNEAGITAVTVSGAGTPNSEDYPNRRSEAWFDVAEQAEEGLIDLSRLPEEGKNALRAQLMSVTWTVNTRGQREVVKKDKTRKVIKRSPDDADALNLAFYRPNVAAMKPGLWLPGQSDDMGLGKMFFGSGSLFHGGFSNPDQDDIRRAAELFGGM